MMPDNVQKTSKCSSCDGWGRVADPQHGQGQKCEPCGGAGVVLIIGTTLRRVLCGVDQCQRQAMPDRKICENHAFPAARPPKTTGRRAAILATKKKLAAEAKVSEDIAEKTKVSKSTDEFDEEIKGET